MAPLLITAAVSLTIGLVAGIVVGFKFGRAAERFPQLIDLKDVYYHERDGL